MPAEFSSRRNQSIKDFIGLQVAVELTKYPGNRLTSKTWAYDISVVHNWMSFIILVYLAFMNEISSQLVNDRNSVIHNYGFLIHTKCSSFMFVVYNCRSKNFT